jgi:hypothetical protein
MVLGVEDGALSGLGAEDRQDLKDLLTRLMGVEGPANDGRDP